MRFDSVRNPPESRGINLFTHVSLLRSEKEPSVTQKEVSGSPEPPKKSGESTGDPAGSSLSSAQFQYGMVTLGSILCSSPSILRKNTLCHGRKAACSPDSSEWATCQTLGSVWRLAIFSHLPDNLNSFTAPANRSHSSLVSSRISFLRSSDADAPHTPTNITIIITEKTTT